MSNQVKTSPWLSRLMCKLVGHSLKWEYVDDKSCQIVETCKYHCGYRVEKMGSHSFGEWEYEKQGECQQVRVCSRDNYVERREQKHDYGNQRKCRRCSHVRPCPSSEHNWEFKQDLSQCVAYYECSICGNIKDEVQLASGPGGC